MSKQRSDESEMRKRGNTTISFIAICLSLIGFFMSVVALNVVGSKNEAQRKTEQKLADALTKLADKLK